MRSIRLIAAVPLVLLPLVAACSAGSNAETLQEKTVQNGVSATVGTVSIRDAYVVGPATGSAPLYLTLFNSGASSDTLTAVSTPAAASVTLGGDGGSSASAGSGSAAVDLQIPAGRAAVTLESAARSLLLTGLTAPLALGQDVSVTFTFSKAGSITLNVPVEGPNGNAQSAVPSEGQASPGSGSSATSTAQTSGPAGAADSVPASPTPTVSSSP